MVSNEQRNTNSGAVIAAISALAVLAAPAFSQPGPKTFYADDPLLREPPPRVVKQVAQSDVDDLYDFLENSFATPRKQGKAARQGPHPALDVNTLGDVQDSAWYTNRHYYRRMSVQELKRGPGNSNPPAEGRWRVISAKINGVTPGFVIEDAQKNRYVLKLDPPQYPELPSAADVIGSKALYALGYNTPENYIVHFRREELEIGADVTWRDASGKNHPLTGRMLDEMLRPQPKRADGSYRAMASRVIAGELVGPFRYQGTRTDDPNDTIAHEDRRALRGFAVFAAWLNHHDTKAINTMDSLVDEGGLRYVKHYLMDFGDILGSNGVQPKYAWSGHEYTVDGKGSLRSMLTLGFAVPRWARAKYPSFTGVGRFDSWSFDPVSWKPNYPNPAFLLMDRDDAFWAAKQVAAFTDAEIRALVETGDYTDPRAAEWIAESLMKRRDKIAQVWFSKVLPLDNFRVLDGNLTFEDLSARSDSGARPEYAVEWTSWDRNGRPTVLAGAIGTDVPNFTPDTLHLSATLRRAAGEPAADDPVTVYLRAGKAGPEVVGVERW